MSPDDDFDDRLAELESTLRELQSSLDRPPRRFRPPTPRELLRFTDEYTIPTVIAVLEANIRALELLRRVIRLADPSRPLDEESAAARSGADAVRREATEGLSDALSELRTALAEADLPDDSESRSIVQDARELSAEIERRIEESRRGGRPCSSRDEATETGSSGRSDGADGPVTIEVTDGNDTGADGPGEEENGRARESPSSVNGSGADGASDRADDASDRGEPSAAGNAGDAGVDVESELQSIKDELREEQAGDGTTARDATEGTVGGDETETGGDADTDGVGVTDDEADGVDEGDGSGEIDGSGETDGADGSDEGDGRN